MPVIHGKDGVVRFGANQIAKTKSFDIQEEGSVKDATAQGDEWDEHTFERKKWSSTITCWFDSSDANGQEAAQVGVAVALELYPGGLASGQPQYDGNGTITKRGLPVSMGDNVELSLEIQGNGALTKSTVA